MPVKPDIIGNLSMDAAWWRKAAQEAIRRYCGWHIAPNITETLTVDAYGGRTLLLPSKHVTDVTAITIDDTDVTGQCDWSEAGVITLRAGQWPDRPRSVHVTLSHGWEPEEVPDVQQLILQLARRARGMPGNGMIQSQTVNGASVGYFSAGGGPLSLQLLQIEKEALAPYKLDWSPR